MNGFKVIQQPLVAEPESSNDNTIIGNYNYQLNSGDCYTRTLADGSLFIFDGYIFPESLESLSNAVALGDFTILDRLEGHFSGVYISEKGVLAFNDRFGGKTIYWQNYQKQLILCSRSHLMPLYELDVCSKSASELVEYRWTSNDRTLLSNIQQLKTHHLAHFYDNHKVKQKNYWSLPKIKMDNVADIEKITATKNGLVNCLKEARKRYSKVAVFLSGGVDSSILAALSKDIFEDCYLVTPVFKGEENPELDNAKAFAKTLNLPLHLVEVDPLKLEKDLKTLIELKREPLRHYSSLAMMAMVAAIPKEYQAIVYGEAADTLFGSNGIKRVLTHAKWKKQVKFLPKFVLSLLKYIAPGRANVLLKLKRLSMKELVLASMKIKYTSKQQELLDELLGQPLDSDVMWDFKTQSISSTELRYATQDRILSCDAGTHFQEAELIAQIYDKHIISPFLTPEVVDVAITLSPQQYFGSDYVKPILRELACEFFNRDLIYQQKHGFPVPFVSWLKGPLAHLVTSVETEDSFFDGRVFQNLIVEDNYEVIWLAINWQLLRYIFAKQHTLENKF